MNGEKFNSYLKISLIVLNCFVINIYTFLFSLLSLGILTPALVGASYCEIQKIIDYDMTSINKRFFTNIKNHLKKTLGKIFLLHILVVILILSLVLFNNLVADSYSSTFYFITVGLQMVMLFEAMNIMQISLIQLFIFDKKEINEVLLNSFLIVNTHILKFLLASVSFVITIVLVNKIAILGLVFISINIALYYISVRQTIIDFYENQNKIINQ